jgi:transaldolase
MTSLQELQLCTTIVADTGDIDAIAEHRPQDATTNPSLILKAASLPRYQSLVQDAISAARAHSGGQDHLVDDVIDRLCVNFGLRILQLIPGRVSTEVDARLSFDTQATLDRARRLIDLYAAAGIAPDRILIKIASTWEGIDAARQLEKQGIHCNLTLLFGFGQAVACADAGVTLISPFVGRIYDWYCRDHRVDSISIAEDPGVASVVRIYDHYKNHGYQTEVMGASFRTIEQVIALAGCDLLTIAPALLQQLRESDLPVPRRLSPESARKSSSDRLELSESTFRWMLNEDAMATEKLAEGIRGFSADLDKLRARLRDLI